MPPMTMSAASYSSPPVRNEIVRDLVTQMFSFRVKPDTAFCTQAARKLVLKYKFMRDVGSGVSGYVSHVKNIKDGMRWQL